MRTHDYATAGVYFVTICTHGKRCILGRIIDDRAVLSRIGVIAHECWRAISEHSTGVDLDAYVVMPNHIHGLIVLPRAPRARHAVPLQDNSVLAPARSFGSPQSRELPTVVRSFKSACTRRVNQMQGTAGEPLWQRGYHEHVVRGSDDLEQLRRYIAENPLNWALDRENPQFGKQKN
jgi:REP element-mobilizing transposase RayT